MKTLISSKNVVYLYLFCFSLLQTAVFAQDTQKKEKTEEDDNVHIRIEKTENGKTTIIERTYKAGEEPERFWGDNFLGGDKDLLKGFGDGFKFYTDSSFSHGPSNFYFRTPDTDDPLFFYKDGDSTGNHVFRYDFDQHNLDSLINSQLKNSQIIIMDMNKRLKGMNIDSLMELHDNSMKDFNFQWDNSDFIFPNPYNGDDLNLLLDKDLYDVEEVETDKGKKMLRINPKDKKKNKENKKSKNLRESMQLSPSSFNLYPNPADGMVKLNLNLPETGTTTITVVNAQGKEVYKERLKDFTGKYIKQIDLSKEGSGVFVVQVVQNNNHLSRKIYMK
ncbi:T9SS type A sorting domain-containing protein [Rhodocytophaga rosea]|uniref:T9SS type A sorting domain-containing protein n=1 Tax=Rhodocytophaga rosea TaxID=2704465 RepID=A0A6C0GE92_9BACT|nr:T9SS type A sorting domain-containing protein [Rhodocytophaga rosea]QHT66286.1 T9SS type A sorting domain-containing protein [Rhodocytophaga rosea]